MMDRRHLRHRLKRLLRIADHDVVDVRIRGIEVTQKILPGMMHRVHDWNVHKTGSRQPRRVVQVKDVAIVHRIFDCPEGVIHVFQV